MELEGGQGAFTAWGMSEDSRGRVCLRGVRILPTLVPQKFRGTAGAALLLLVNVAEQSEKSTCY